jgi:hypothetical protein
MQVAALHGGMVVVGQMAYPNPHMGNELIGLVYPILKITIY